MQERGVRMEDLVDELLAGVVRLGIRWVDVEIDQAKTHRTQHGVGGHIR